MVDSHSLLARNLSSLLRSSNIRHDVLVKIEYI